MKVKIGVSNRHVHLTLDDYVLLFGNETIKKDEDLIELLSQIDIDKEIPSSMYRAVAEIFSFIYDLSNKAKK